MNFFKLLTGLGLIFLLTPVMAYSQDLETKSININLHSVTLEKALAEIEKQSQITIFYGEDVNKYAANKVSIAADNITVADALTKTLAGTNLSYSRQGSQIMIKEGPASSQQRATGRGTLSGTVLDESGTPITGATVSIPETTTGTATDVNGKYTLPGIPTGITDVQFSFTGYGTQRITGVKITANRLTPLDIVLKEATEQLGDVVVTATYSQASVVALLMEQKERISVSDGISADIIKKTSDNNLAQVMRRIAGISVNDGKFIAVRGLSERYNNVTLNGALMPSTEPNRKNFNFELIPTGLVDNVVVIKSFRPDMSAEFGGGGMEINTLSTPNKPFFNVSIGTGFNSNSIGKDFWGGKRFDSDYLLGNNDARYWMERDWVMSEYSQFVEGNNFRSPEAAAKATRMNAKIPGWWSLNKTKAMPVQNLSVSLGKTYSLGEHKLGVVFGANYRHEETIRTHGTDNIMDPNEVEIDYATLPTYESYSYEFTTSLSAIANLSWEWKGHRIGWKNLFTNRFVNQSSLENSFEDSNNNYFVTVVNSPQRNYIQQTHLEGEHPLWEGLSADWYWDFTQVNQDRPDERQVRGLVYNGKNHDGYDNALSWGYWANGTDAGAFDHIYSYGMQEWKRNVGGSLQYKFDVLGNEQMVKAGYDFNNRDSRFMQYWLNVGKTPRSYSISAEERAFHNKQEFEDYYSPANFAKGLLVMYPWGENPGGDGYDGSLDINSAYLMGTFKFWKNRIVLSGGVRNEKSKMSTIVEWTEQTDSIQYDQSDWFPSVNLSVEPVKNVVLRAGFNKTIARFDFRESFPMSYYDVQKKMDVFGNDSLRNTHIRNFDFRAEWYPTPGEVISIGYFIKDFTDPIEQFVSDPTGTKQFVMKPMNLKSAGGKGVEVNFRKNLGFIAPASILKNMWLSTNAMTMDMEVRFRTLAIRSQDSVRSRPLQDLVPYTVNAMLSYEGEIFGVAVSYGTTGRKLLQAASHEYEDEYEASRHTLDLQLSSRLLKRKMEIKFNISDILAQPYVRYMNKGFKNKYQWGLSDRDTPYLDDMNYNRGKDWMLERSRRGTNYSLSVNYSF